ncbi:hypothetical protein [Brachybacterium paraconglomeratum]|uniref:hypothetical protein n=1 Tax=Brachybacterium paraconglomeratum TaxID=173362 RepID=UPI00223C0D00|nr:hypothetical protein [Brachybacterium paraconglomeratum]MCT1436229.1 hypothetical protein [Brachybacterium paraconglomeratum]
MPPLPSYRIFRAAWIMARAFTPHIVLTLLALPWTLLSVIPGTLRRGLYLDPTRTGMVMLYRSNPVLDVLVLFPIMLITFGAYFAAATALVNIAGWLALALPVATGMFMIGLLFLLPRGGGSLFPWGPETPDGPRWEIAGLAQLPGTRLTGIQLALRALDTVPPAGSVIVATANSEDLYRQYQAFGFTGGPKHRVHRIAT